MAPARAPLGAGRLPAFHAQEATVSGKPARGTTPQRVRDAALALLDDAENAPRNADGSPAGITLQDVASAVGLARDSVRMHVQNLVEEGVLDRSGRGANARYVRGAYA